MFKKKIAAVAAAVAIVVGSTTVPAFAYVPQGTETTAESTQTSNPTDTATENTGAAGTDASAATATESAASGTNQSADQSAGTDQTANGDAAGETESSGALTPEGNMTLVDSVTSSSGSKQFMTLTTRDGNFYYLIIDYDKDGNQNVHFLNQVDERDLIGLVDDNEAEELKKELAEKDETVETTSSSETAPTETATQDSTPTTEPEKTITIAGFKISQRTAVGIIGLALLALLCIVGFIVLGKKKKSETKKQDPDADYDADLSDEIDIPEDSENQDDFEE